MRAQVRESIEVGRIRSTGPSAGFLDIQRCRFERNLGRVIEFDGANYHDLKILDCKFNDNRASWEDGSTPDRRVSTM